MKIGVATDTSVDTVDIASLPTCYKNSRFFWKYLKMHGCTDVQKTVPEMS